MYKTFKSYFFLCSTGVALYFILTVWTAIVTVKAKSEIDVEIISDIEMQEVPKISLANPETNQLPTPETPLMIKPTLMTTKVSHEK